MAMEKESWIKIAAILFVISIILTLVLAANLHFFDQFNPKNQASVATENAKAGGLTPKAQELLARGAVESTADKAAPVLNQPAATPVAKAPEKPAETKVIAKTPEPEATAAKAAIPVVVPETEKTPGVSKEEFQQEVNKLKAAISYQAGKLDACCDYSKPAASQEKISHPNKAIGKHPLSGQSKGRKARIAGNKNPTKNADMPSLDPKPNAKKMTARPVGNCISPSVPNAPNLVGVPYHQNDVPRLVPLPVD